MTRLSYNERSRFQLRLMALFAGALTLLFGPAAIAGDKNPYAMPDDTWITISGSVETVSRDAFTLDYGDGLITVEMDDGDRDADAYQLIAGDKVTVTGIIDDDFFEMTKIEAASVFVENIGTTFFSSPRDEETTGEIIAPFSVPVVVSEAVVYGTVTDIESDEFTLNTGTRSVNVEVGSMPYNPLDDEGYQKLRVGDRVKVRGDIDHDFFDGREIEAEYIIKLSTAS